MRDGTLRNIIRCGVNTGGLTESAFSSVNAGSVVGGHSGDASL